MHNHVTTECRGGASDLKWFPKNLADAIIASRTEPTLSDDFRPSKFHLSNSEINATGQLVGGAVANICRELLQLREKVYDSTFPSKSHKE